jgi:hypothetical protein
MWIRLKTAPLDSLKHKKALFLSDRKGRWISFGQILSNFRGATQIALIEKIIDKHFVKQYNLHG